MTDLEYEAEVSVRRAWQASADRAEAALRHIAQLGCVSSFVDGNCRTTKNNNHTPCASCYARAYLEKEKL